MSEEEMRPFLAKTLDLPGVVYLVFDESQERREVLRVFSTEPRAERFRDKLLADRGTPKWLPEHLSIETSFADAD